MINVGSHYKYINDLISKNNGVFISPEEYERYGHASSLEMFDDFAGIKTTPRTAYGRSRAIDERLRPYRKKVPMAFVNELLTIPQELRMYTAIYTAVGKIPLKPIDEDRYARIFQDPLASPNDDDKYYLEEEGVLTLLGEEDLNVVVHYLEKPQPIKYAYTIVNNRPVYDDANSIHYKWSESEQEELTNRILAKLGLSMANTLEIQVANTNKAQE